MLAQSATDLGGLSRIREHDPVKQCIRSKLSKNQLFKAFSEDEISRFCNHLVGYRAEKGDAVFIEGQKTGYLCIIIDGLLHVVKETGTGKSRKITEVSTGQLVGEMALIDGKPHSATAIAAEPVLLAALTERSLNDMVRENPAMGAKLYREIAVLLSHRLRETGAEFVNYLE
jgi:CRP-like cAMP-binding protein